jgi:DNA-binding beta-propeller fold protein YncE
VIPIGGTISSLFLSPDGKSLYYLNATDAAAGKIDLATLKKGKEARREAETPLLTMSRDGKRLYLVEADGADCLVWRLDPESMAVGRVFAVKASPYDVAVRDDGLLFLSGGRGEWTEVTVVDADAEKVVARWGGVWTKSLLQLNASQDRLYVSTQGVSPGTVEAFPLPAKLDEKPSVYRFASPDKHALGGEFLVSPDGKFLLAKTGTVLRLGPSRDEDLQPVTKLDKFAAAVVDVEHGAALLLSGDGVLRHYSYPDFKLRGTHKIGIVSYQAVLDPKSGKLYVAGFDPADLGGRAKARGFGDVFVFDVRSLLQAR